MGNLRSFVQSIFTGFVSTTDMEKAKEAGKRDADLLTGAYVEGFSEGVSKKLEAQRAQILGLPYDAVDLEDPSESSRMFGMVIDVEDVESIELKEATNEDRGLQETTEDYSTWSRPELMREAKSRGLKVTRTSKSVELRNKLVRNDSKATV
jgi:hypothetical protein